LFVENFQKLIDTHVKSITATKVNSSAVAVSAMETEKTIPDVSRSRRTNEDKTVPLPSKQLKRPKGTVKGFLEVNNRSKRQKIASIGTSIGATAGQDPKV
jgi:hypothetical protein